MLVRDKGDKYALYDRVGGLAKVSMSAYLPDKGANNLSGHSELLNGIPAR
jgi:hypothetical protein